MTETHIDPRKLAAIVYDDRVSIDALMAARMTSARPAPR
jgi:hypothetical protein